MLRQRSRLVIVIKVGGASPTRCYLADAYTALMAVMTAVSYWAVKYAASTSNVTTVERLGGSLNGSEGR